MMKRVEVAGVQEAVALASEYQQKGEYDWFRGQTSQRPPYSSLFRLQMRGDDDAILRNKRRIAMFARWVTDSPQLSYLLEPQHVHQFFAILQHYGVATFYLDFSTDPAIAGFFACDTNSAPTSGLSCIYCLNSADLTGMWESWRALGSRKGAELETVAVNVKNLWRLQAQAGVFLYTNYNWDVDYPMDRIVFPYTGYPTVPTKDRIYPIERSALEHLLDEYFAVEQSTFGNEELRNMVAEINERGGHATYTVLEVFDRGIYAGAFHDASLVREDPSWKQVAVDAWLTLPDEEFQESVGRTLRLQVSDKSLSGLSANIRYGVVQSLRSTPSLRAQSIEFVFTGSPVGTDFAALARLLQRAWNGMRLLPYTSEDIGDCLSRVASLHVLGFAAIDSPQREQCLGDNFGRSCPIAFGPSSGAGTKSWATIANLLGALRPDLDTMLLVEHRQRAQDIQQLFQVIYNPRLMFQFNHFKDMFARELIAPQILDERAYVHFNPTTVATFGNP